MKSDPSRFLVDMPKPKPPQFKGLSIGRQFLLFGWARYACSYLADFERQQVEVLKRRPKGHFGILVEDDDHALMYQWLEFRICRVKFAVGKYGLVGKASYGESGFIWAGQDEILEENRASLQKHRDQAVRASKRYNELQSSNPPSDPKR